MSQSLPLELLNGALFILALCASCVFTHYLWTKRSLGYYALQPALALACIFYGETLLRGMFWFVRNQINNGVGMQQSNEILVVGSIIATVGILCSIRVFSPDSWGNKGWVVSLALTVLFLIWSAFN